MKRDTHRYCAQYELAPWDPCGLVQGNFGSPPTPLRLVPSGISLAVPRRLRKALGPSFRIAEQNSFNGAAVT